MKCILFCYLLNSLYPFMDDVVVYQFIPELEQMAQGEITYLEQAEETKIINEYQVYQILDQNPELIENSQVLMDFYNHQQESNSKRIQRTEDLMNVGEFDLAHQEIDAMSLNNTIDVNDKMFYEIFLRQHLDSITSAEDSVLLVNIASLCPFTDGAIVYQARALYHALYNYNRTFEDSCKEEKRKPEDTHEKSLKNENENTNLINTDFDIVMFPNPTDGILYFSDSNSDEKLINLIIYDIAGKIVYQQNLISNGQIRKIELNIGNGLYTISFINTTNHEKINKKVWISH